MCLCFQHFKFVSEDSEFPDNREKVSVTGTALSKRTVLAYSDNGYGPLGCSPPVGLLPVPYCLDCLFPFSASFLFSSFLPYSLFSFLSCPEKLSLFEMVCQISQPQHPWAHLPSLDISILFSGSQVLLCSNCGLPSCVQKASSM